MSNIPEHIQLLKEAVDHQDAEKFLKIITKKSSDLNTLFVADESTPHIKRNIAQYVVLADIKMSQDEKDETLYNNYQNKPFYKMYEALKNQDVNLVELEVMKGFNFYYESSFADKVANDCLIEIKNNPELLKTKEVDDLNTADWMLFAIKNRDLSAIKTIMKTQEDRIFFLEEVGTNYGTTLENAIHYADKPIIDTILSQADKENINKNIQHYTKTPVEVLVNNFSITSKTKQPFAVYAIQSLLDKGAEFKDDMPDIINDSLTELKKGTLNLDSPYVKPTNTLLKKDKKNKP